MKIPTPRNDSAFESVDAPYYAAKAKDPTLTYAQFMMRKEFDAVSRNLKHASLGANVPDRDEKGSLNFNFYQRLASIQRDDRVVEYGCGTLRIGEKFIAYLDRGNYLGLDVEPGFLNMGKELLPGNLLTEKVPTLIDVSVDSIDRAAGFRANFVFSNSVAYHIHQEDLAHYFAKLARVSSAPGAVLVFDAKISDEAVRYNSGGWSWSLDLYKELLRPMKFEKLHNARPYAHAEHCTVAHLEFRSPI